VRSLLAWLSIVVVVLISVARPLAIERRRLPQFSLTTPDGRVVASTTLVKPGRWVVIYVPSACGGCGELLRLVVKDDQPLLPQRIAIVVGGVSPDGVKAAAAQFPDLAEAAWYADPSGASVGPLQLGSAPAVFGLNDDVIEWSLSGVLAASPSVKAVLGRWIDRR
jgi:hypothetical protein